MQVRQKHSKVVAFVLILAASLIPIVGESAFAQSAVMPPGLGTQADPFLISEIGHLVWMANTATSSVTNYYSLTNDINVSATATWNDSETDTSILEGFRPIGTYSSPDSTSFQGTFDGNGNKIIGLTINRPALDNVGLFGFVGTYGKVRNLRVIGGTITGKGYVGGSVGRNSGAMTNVYAENVVMGEYYVGGLVGLNSRGSVSNSRATGNVSGTGDYIGGLAGYNFISSTISGSYATGTVTGGHDFVGGLVGGNFGTLTNTYATGAVTGNYDVGGLAGCNDYGSITKSRSSGAVSGNYYVGGLVGSNYSSTISTSQATGTVAGSRYVGGLVGLNQSGSTVSNVYSTVSVTGMVEYVGGLVGWNQTGASVTNTYSIGAVSGTGSYFGGLIGRSQGTVSSSYWNTQTSGFVTSSGGTGKTTAQMMQKATFVGWDFASLWNIFENVTYPFWRSKSDHGDFNNDGYVNLLDANIFAACASGPAIEYDYSILPEPSPGCTLVPDIYGNIAADFDRDGIVDQDDFATFQRCWTGTTPGDPNCVN